MNTKQLRTTYQLKASLEGSKPLIWRCLLANNDIKLDTFHLFIQVPMGWASSLSHQYITKDHGFYGIKDNDFDFDIKEESKFRLSQLPKHETESLIYEYDFGDSWIHTVTLEKIRPFDPDKKLTYCVTGKRAYLSEDGGGIWSYSDLLTILEDPKHPEYEEKLDWIGDGFDPVTVDSRESNQLLLEYYC
ncbi:hypothetical protein AU255_01715 [Methyloprofundus sedimenti]|uniref:Plasmid pRiA4b Orf3-like domain-containing protein n=1 Tax=Methyloprofundus sedimenti TaxID=1420851 RepID=A0A1V8M560_9GAMM|nr:plasmid pRiA4b ORF-3 family protein [Methyloprofundus sedimenti]OQK16648.1 hypothetical protein AU255_01715 [Methyloprofundus sedimenti]